MLIPAFFSAIYAVKILLVWYNKAPKGHLVNQKYMKHHKKKLKLLAVCIVMAVLTVIAGHFVNAWQARTDAEKLMTGTVAEVTVRSVIDGDTLLLKTDDEKLRLTGIDAPESVHRDESKNTVYGSMASDHLKELVHAGSTVYIYLPDDQKEDIRERDNYDRLLRLVWTSRPDISGGLTEELLRQSLNGRMLLDGYAVAYIMEEEPWGDLFYRFQKEAMDAAAGLWADPGWIAHAALNELVQ